LHVDTGGVLWIATESSVSRVSGRPDISAAVVEGAWSPNIASMAADASGTLWICEQGNGLFRLTNGHLSAFNPSPDIDHTANQSHCSRSRRARCGSRSSVGA